MAENQDVWVFTEKPALLPQLISGAQLLTDRTGGQVIAVVCGPRFDAEQALSHGLKRVLWLGEPKEGMLIDDYVPTIADAMKGSQPYAVLIASTKRGRAIAGRLAARFNVTVLTDVLEFIPEGNTLQARHMIFGGGAVRVDRPLALPIIATVGLGVFLPQMAQTRQAAPGSEIVEVPFVEPTVHATIRERKPRKVASVNLAGARKVVCAGRGVAKQEDLSMVEELAKLLGAEMACTRPLAEGLAWLPRERYLGISGATIKPDLYLGVGVSGQVQHQIGMNGSKIVVAINKDENAPIFTNADYIIPEDLYVVVPALIKALKDR